MLLKVLYIFLGYLLVDGFILKTHAANVIIRFNVITEDDSCKSSVVGGKYYENNNTLILHEDDLVNIHFISGKYMNIIECFVNGNTKLFDTYENPKSRDTGGKDHETSFTIDHINNATKSGLWYCEVCSLKNVSGIKGETRNINGTTYKLNKCSMSVSFEPPQIFKLTLYEYIYIGGGVLVVIVIIAQTAVILYLKAKAKRITRMDGLALRPLDKNKDDKKRYSRPPGEKKSRFGLAILRKKSNQDEERIYETLEELRNADQTPPVPPLDTIPTLKKKPPNDDPDIVSKSLPRPKKTHQMAPMPATLHRIPERNKSPDLDISSRPPLPLPNELPEDEGNSGALSRSKSPLSTLEEAGASNNNTLSRTKVGQSLFASELNNAVKTRKPSVVTATAQAPTPPKKHSFPPFKGKRKVAIDAENPSENGNFIPEVPSPYPTGKSAILLGLAPGAPSKPRAKAKALSPPPTSEPPPNPFTSSIPPSAPSKPSLPSNTALKPFALPGTPLKPVTPFGSPLKPVVLPGTPLKPGPPPNTPQKPANPFGATLKPVALPGLKPVGSSPSPAPIRAVPKPAVKPPGSIPLPKQPHALVKQPGTSKPVAAVIPKQGTHQPFKLPTPQVPRPGLQPPPPSKWKPKPLPPPEEPVQEVVYAESDEPVYNDEEVEQEPHRLVEFKRPAPMPLPSRNRPPPLPPPNNASQNLQEGIYEEYAEEIDNSDDEWNYEPLKKYNIYSN